MQILQMSHRQRFVKRNTEDLVIGESYGSLRRSIGISILNFNLNERKAYHSVYRLRDEVGNEFTDVLEIHIIELKKELTG